MKRLAIFVVALLQLSASMPAFADGTPANRTVSGDTSKAECLLISKGCKDQVDSISEKIARLNNEIKKGSKVYSVDELKRLESKLRDTENFLIQMNEQ